MKTVLLSALISLWSVAAFAHSPLQSTTPADGAVLAAPPSDIVMVFKGKIRLTRVTLAHAKGDAQDLVLGDQTAFQQDFMIPLSDFGAGEYLITWRGLGDDGHAQTGVFAFRVQ